MTDERPRAIDPETGDELLLALRVWDGTARAPDLADDAPPGHSLAIGARVEAHMELRTIGEVAAVLIVLATIEADLLRELATDARVTPAVLAGILTSMHDEVCDAQQLITARLDGHAGVTS